MTDFFRELLNRSISAGILIFVIILLRVLLKKAPKWLHCLLWAVAALRLILPSLPESALSLNPRTELVPEMSYSEPAVLPVEQSAGGVASPGELHPAAVVQPEKPRTEPLKTLGWVWFGGLLLMLGYAAFSTEKLRRKVGASVREEGNIFLCDGISSPFILGIVFPHIYLPSEMDLETREHVLAHERAHLSRGDQLWKPLGWLLLSVYWFHPLVWLGYILLCRDIELACDEKVVKAMETPEKAAYSQALLNCSLPRRMVTACPLAFGETGVKTRVKNVLNYRKPALWVIFAAAVLCIAAAVCFLTKPKTEDIFGYRYTPVEFVERAEKVHLPSEEIRSVVLDKAGNLYLTLDDGDTQATWKAGQLTEFRPTKRNFEIRFHVEEGKLIRRTVRRAYRCVFTLPGTEELCYADVLELRGGKLQFVLGWQDEESLTDPDSDDSAAWWYAVLQGQGEAASAVRPSVSGCAAAVLRERLSDASAIVTGEIDSLKTFDSLILEPTGEPFDEIWKYSIVFDPPEIVKGRESIEVLIGAESVGIDGWKYTASSMEGVLEWVEGKLRYFIEEEPAGELPMQKPELRITGWQGDALAHNSTADGLWRQPPELYIPRGDGPVWLWQGTYSWDYDFGGVDAGGMEMDCASPWLLMKDQPEYIPTLTAFAGDSIYLAPEPGGDKPQRITVYAIEPSQWGEIDPERTELPISADGFFVLPEGEYLYSVGAVWQEETYGGTCWYAFYCDSRSAKTGVVERMGSATAETVLEIFSRYPVDENTLSEALRRAAEAGPTEAPEAFVSYYEVEVYFSGGAAGFTGEDEHLHLRAGLEENLVEVFFKPRLGKTETRYFRDEAMYRIVRENGYEIG